MWRTGIAIGALWLLWAHAPRTVAAQEAVTPNLQRLKTDLLVVTAHPDDESMMAATMARCADEGRVVSLVVCTRGEGGGNGTGKESGVSLGVVREAELRQALGLLGTRTLYFLNQPDWAYTESVRATLERWGHDETLKRLVRLVRLLRPDVVCTMDPAPVGGQHGHHQAAGRLATEAFEAAADPNAFPELLHDEGLTPWRVLKLYWTSFGGGGTLQLATDGVAHGALAAANPGRRYADIALTAESSHRSQGFDKFFGSLAGSAPPPAFPNNFLLVKSRVPVDPKAEKDLFDGAASALADGLPRGGGDVLAAALPPPMERALECRIRPRPDIRDYQAWLQANGIARLLSRLPAHVSAAVGTTSPVVVELLNRSGAPYSGRLTLQLPPGWKTEAAERRVTSTKQEIASVTFQVTPSPDAKPGSYDVTAILGEGGNGLRDPGKLDLVPKTDIARLTRPLPVDADVAKWEQAGVAPVAIPNTNTAQGETKGPEEISGRFFAGYAQDGLQVLVDVTDDTVVANIAPDDIKAHWRSTSAEICLDPTPRSENTFRTLKLGIFPQDTTGRVRAARDADAHPGPVEESEPDIRLASKRTPTGYIVEARIPWKALRTTPAFAPKPGRALGFNVILYHAGKRDARPGEDVNKSRLAWSYWPGVWGRPEVWGLAILK